MSSRQVVLWIFGYGSLVWKPDFPYLESHVAILPGFARRFWQGSVDHRGVPGAPGRVVTLVEAPQEHCVGVVFGVSDPERETILERLDHREKGGYIREMKAVELRDRSGDFVEALVYRAGRGNPNFLGPASTRAIAAQVRTSVGPSGENVAYVRELHAALEALGIHDPDVADLASELPTDD